jgi:heterodisulfide reductase subunit A-like polyferredoxin
MSEENTISIDLEKCVGCSQCVNDCPSGYLFIHDGKAKTHEVGCIECGHCFAICPQNAIRMNNFDTTDCMTVVSMTEIDSEKLLLAMKSRRTIRQFKNIEV